jgi:hypothetical protein
MLTGGVTVLGAGIPGSADVLAGRMGLGAIILSVALAGPGVFVAASVLPAPADAGSLTTLVAVVGMWVLLAAGYGAGGLRVYTRIARTGELA